MAQDKKSPRLLGRWIRAQKPGNGGTVVLEREGDALAQLGTWEWEQVLDSDEAAKDIIAVAQDDADARDVKTVYRVLWLLDGGVQKSQHVLRISPQEETEPEGTTEGALKLQLRHNEGLVATLVRVVEAQAAQNERTMNVFIKRLETLEGARGEALEAEREAAMLAGSQTQMDAVMRVADKLVQLFSQGGATEGDVAMLRKLAQHPLAKQLLAEVEGNGGNDG